MSAGLYSSLVLEGWCRVSGNEWTDYIQHPFVKGLSDGTLPETSFHHYLIQDYIFLVHFTRAWSLAVVKSESLEEMKTSATMVNALVNVEIQLHIETCKNIGISEKILFSAKEAFENIAYTRFVMDAGLSGDFLDLMAALSPCVFGYGVIGSMLEKTATSNTPYQEWINAYAGEDYQELCNVLGSMIEKSALSRLGNEPEQNPRWNALCKRFNTATRLEIGFWEMGLRGQ